VPLSPAELRKYPADTVLEVRPERRFQVCLLTGGKAVQTYQGTEVQHTVLFTKVETAP
jgi:hypothetical protein